MKTVAIIQARMGSSRLPGKIMMELGGHPALFHVLDRVRRANRVHQVVVATTVESRDDRVADYAAEAGYPVVRGSENDVLDRYLQAARAFRADTIVRISSDCVVVDPDIVDEVIEAFLAGGYDFCATDDNHPDGLDCEVFTRQILERSAAEATLPSEREHVTPYMRESGLFRVGYRPWPGEDGRRRWVLDEARDLTFLRRIFERLYRPDGYFATADILRLLEEVPELGEINGDIVRNEGYLKSLEEDKRLMASRSAG